MKMNKSLLFILVLCLSAYLTVACTNTKNGQPADESGNANESSRDEMVQNDNNIGEDILDGAGNVAEDIGQAGKDVLDDAGDAAEDIGQTGKDILNGAGDAAEDIGQAGRSITKKTSPTPSMYPAP